MQCKDIPDEPIIAFLREHTHKFKWATWGEGHSMPTIQDAMPAGTPIKLQLAKMRMLIRRGIVSGCPCGCRGDFYLTENEYPPVDPCCPVHGSSELRKLIDGCTCERR